MNSETISSIKSKRSAQIMMGKLEKEMDKLSAEVCKTTDYSVQKYLREDQAAIGARMRSLQAAAEKLGYYVHSKTLAYIAWRGAVGNCD